MSTNQSQPYLSGRGFHDNYPLTRAERKQAIHERQYGHGGLGLRYGEWGQVPNATGEIMRGVGADFDWRTYTPKNIPRQTTGLKGSKWGPGGDMVRAARGSGRPDLPFNGPPLMGPQQPGPTTQQAWGESSLLPADAAKGGMGADSSILPGGSIWPHATGDAGQMSLPGISPDQGGFGTPTWGSSRNTDTAISPQFSRQGQQGTLFGSDGEPSGDTFYRPPSNMGASRR